MFHRLTADTAAINLTMSRGSGFPLCALRIRELAPRLMLIPEGSDSAAIAKPAQSWTVFSFWTASLVLPRLAVLLFRVLPGATREILSRPCSIGNRHKFRLHHARLLDPSADACRLETPLLRLRWRGFPH